MINPSKIKIGDLLKYSPPGHKFWFIVSGIKKNKERYMFKWFIIKFKSNDETELVRWITAMDLVNYHKLNKK